MRGGVLGDGCRTPMEDVVRSEHDKLGFGGRFGAGLPRINDGSFLFLQHMVDKMRPLEEGGSRLAIVFNGSPLFTGAAGSGESEIRRWIIESDWLEARITVEARLGVAGGIGGRASSALRLSEVDRGLAGKVIDPPIRQVPLTAAQTKVVWDALSVRDADAPAVLDKKGHAEPDPTFGTARTCRCPRSRLCPRPTPRSDCARSTTAPAQMRAASHLAEATRLRSWRA